MGKIDWTFYSENHNCAHQDVNVKIVNFCDPNDEEKYHKICGWINWEPEGPN